MDKGHLDDDFTEPLFGIPDKGSKVKDDSSESGEDKSGSGSENNSSDSNSGQESGSSKSDTSSGSGSSSDSESKSDSGSDNHNDNDNARGAPVEYDTDSHTGGVPMEDDTDSQHSTGGKRRRPPRQSNIELKEILRENPDLFGLRRSGRQKKEPVRYNAQGESDDDDEPRGKRGRRRKASDDWNGSESDGSSSGSEDYRPARTFKARPVRSAKRRNAGRSGNKRSAGRPRTRHLSDSDSWSEDDARRFETRKASKKVSYKEDSDDGTDSDDIIEVAQDEEDAEAENRETIERVYKERGLIKSVMVP